MFADRPRPSPPDSPSDLPPPDVLRPHYRANITHHTRYAIRHHGWGKHRRRFWRQDTVELIRSEIIWPFIKGKEIMVNSENGVSDFRRHGAADKGWNYLRLSSQTTLNNFGNRIFVDVYFEFVIQKNTIRIFRYGNFSPKTWNTIFCNQFLLPTRRFCTFPENFITSVFSSSNIKITRKHQVLPGLKYKQADLEYSWKALNFSSNHWIIAILKFYIAERDFKIYTYKKKYRFLKNCVCFFFCIVRFTISFGKLLRCFVPM